MTNPPSIINFTLTEKYIVFDLNNVKSRFPKYDLQQVWTK